MNNSLYWEWDYDSLRKVNIASSLFTRDISFFNNGACHAHAYNIHMVLFMWSSDIYYAVCEVLKRQLTLAVHQSHFDLQLWRDSLCSQQFCSYCHSSTFSSFCYLQSWAVIKYPIVHAWTSHNKKTHSFFMHCSTIAVLMCAWVCM